MVYAEIDDELLDTIKIILGNIEPNEELTVKLSYIETLKIRTKKINTSNNNYNANELEYEIILPFTLSPRYQSFRNNN